MQPNQVNKWVMSGVYDRRQDNLFFFFILQISTLRRRRRSLHENCGNIYCFRRRQRVKFIPLRRLIVLCRFQLNKDFNIFYLTFSFSFFFSLSLSPEGYFEIVSMCPMRDVDEQNSIRNPINAWVFLFLIT